MLRALFLPHPAKTVNAKRTTNSSHNFLIGNVYCFVGARCAAHLQIGLFMVLVEAFGAFLEVGELVAVDEGDAGAETFGAGAVAGGQ